MTEFKVHNAEPAGFTKKIARLMHRGALKNVADLELKGDDLILKFDRMGHSEIHYRVEPESGGFKGVYQSEKIAFTHGMFRKEVENYFIELLKRAGAEIL